MKELLISSIDKLHTTELGIKRIKRNLRIEVEDVVGCGAKKKLRIKVVI